MQHGGGSSLELGHSSMLLTPPGQEGEGGHEGKEGDEDQGEGFRRYGPILDHGQRGHEGYESDESVAWAS